MLGGTLAPCGTLAPSSATTFFALPNSCPSVMAGAEVAEVHIAHNERNFLCYGIRKLLKQW